MLPIDGLTIRRSARLLQALDQMNRAAKGVLLVVDEDGRFERTVTDGDLRRLLLAGQPLESTIASLPRIESVTVARGASTAAIAQAMDSRKIDQVPVLDERGAPIGLWHRRELPTPILLSTPHLSEFEQDYVADAFRTNWIAPLGPNVDAFEREVADKVGSKHAAALSSGTAAIHLGLRVLGVGQGDVVFCSSLTFAASANPIVYQNATPVFIDSEPESWNMSPVALRKAFREAERIGKLPRAVIVVCLYGQSADMDALQSICDEYGVPILEDSAESLGATYKGRQSGTFGKISVYSFNGNKIITTSGGGMLLSDDASLVEQARFLSTQARDPAPHYQHSVIGFNYRMSNILAGVGRGQLRVLDERVESRRAIFDRYREVLGDLPGLRFMPEPSWSRSTRWLTACTIDPKVIGMTRERLVERMSAERIEVRAVWKPMHLQPVFGECRYVTHGAGDGGSVSDRLFENGLCLPSGSNMTPIQQERVIETLRGLLTENASRRVTARLAG
ncbi:MAG: DegT/DnrJ/EryC1/StrS family aminotransferase [Phycisphaerae bacterium]|jgi:dTDP-4-amino-4,6-dideoxygalactose transaminase|nr:DegT/DnrJ/EryC1/StrS family aminotransferase [Phycisphaerae bacterium]